jgi:RES domain-containing protein
VSWPIYRIAHADYAKEIWVGNGGLFSAGRWNIAGKRIVYAASSLALAQLEVLAHIPDRMTAPPLVLGIGIAPDDLYVEEIHLESLPEQWRRYSPYSRELQAMGDDWLKRRASCIFQVPSAVSIFDKNILINPEHPDFKRLESHAAQPHIIDPRLL